MSSNPNENPCLSDSDVDEFYDAHDSKEADPTHNIKLNGEYELHGEKKLTILWNFSFLLAIKI